MSGGAGGIGSAMVHRFLNDGASVAIVDRDLERAHQLVNQLWTDYADNNQVIQSGATSAELRSQETLLQY